MSIPAERHVSLGEQIQMWVDRARAVRADRTEAALAELFGLICDAYGFKGGMQPRRVTMLWDDERAEIEWGSPSDMLIVNVAGCVTPGLMGTGGRDMLELWARTAIDTFPDCIVKAERSSV